MNIPKVNLSSNKMQQLSSYDITNNVANKTVVTKDAIIVANFGPECQVLKCPYCQGFVNTKVKSKITTKTHLCAVIMCLFGCCLCFGCPYCRGSCKDRYHYCPECNAFLGLYHY